MTIAWVMAAGIFVPASHAAPLTDSICISEALGDPNGNFCTANDVRITEFECVNCPADCAPGTEYTATLLATIESGPDRFGIGLWFNEDGLGAKTPGAECTRDILEPAGPNQSCDSSAGDGLGPFWDANGDACGDVTQDAAECPGVVIAPCSEGGGNCAIHKRVVEVTTVCVDTDGDNIADISSCTSWDQNPNTCNGPGDTEPGTSSKCHCAPVSTGEIFTGCRTDEQCSNGLFCDGAEVCNTATAECEPGTPPVCDDGVSCTVDSCNEGTDSCDHGPDDSLCSNGQFCDGTELCDASNDCQPGTPPNCDDGVTCTVDSCNEGTDSCDHGPDDSLCANGLFCDGDETCDATNDCQPGAPPDCSDGVSCTVDSCNEGTDSCDHGPDDSLCANGLFCDGDETCDAVNDCQPGSPPDCGDGVGCTVDACNEDTDSCDNTPNDGLCADGNVCNGPESCDAQLDCQPGLPLPEGTPCGDQTDTACTDPDFCSDDGVCLNNNEVCGAITTSALCEFDVEPDKGRCEGGDEDGHACSMGDPAVCEAGGGGCVQENQFRLAFGPDVQNWVAYRPPHSNPGQFYYNAFYDGSGAIDGQVIAIEVPWPFVTQGATPLHVYDGNDVGTLETCFMPGEALMAEKRLITREDWIQPPGYVAPDWLSCDPVQGPGGSGFCTLLVDIPQAVIDAAVDNFLYINLHMDYGLKGNFTDANPWNGIVDRYDRGGDASPWGSYDALMNTSDNTGPVAIADCSDYTMSHHDEGGLLFDDTVQNLNEFKRFTGVFGRVSCNEDDSAIGGYLWLRRVGSGTVRKTEIDAEGYYAMGFKHKGRTAAYELKWCDVSVCGGNWHITDTFDMKSNSSVQVDLTAGDLCDDLRGRDDRSDWEPISPQYLDGKPNNN